MTTLADARRALAGKFRSAGLDSPDLDARILAGHAFGLSHAALITNATRELGTDKTRTLDALTTHHQAELLAAEAS